MRARTWLPAGAVALLVVGVLATRGGTAAAEEDLAPPPVAQPSPEESGPPGFEPVLLEADGLPVARLGTAGEALALAFPAEGPDAVQAEDLPGGCMPAWSPPADGSTQQWETTAWLVDGVVASVVLSRWDPTTAVLPDLRTWLGPTIGSPVAAASELPGARTSLERPHGPEGPVVTVVHVRLDDVEVVFSDASQQMADRPEEAVGRITTLEVRDPRARACSMEAVAAAGPALSVPGAAPELVVGPDGLTAAPVGTPVDQVRLVPGLTAEPGAAAGCEVFVGASTAGGWVRVVVVAGVVVRVDAYGPVGSTLGVEEGDGMDVVRAVYPALAERQGDGWGSHEVTVGTRVLGIELSPGQEWVPDVDVAVQGGPPVVQSLSVRDAAVPSAGLC